MRVGKESFDYFDGDVLMKFNSEELVTKDKNYNNKSGHSSH